MSMAINSEVCKSLLRLSKQPIAPAKVPATDDSYSLYPAFPIEPGAIRYGFEALAEVVSRSRWVRIDGYVGVLWNRFQNDLAEALERLGVSPIWLNVSDFLKPPEVIASLTAPFLGGNDPLFGTKFQGALRDFFEVSQIEEIVGKPRSTTTIVYGCGAALVPGEGPLIYVDVPKNEIQFRSRAGAIGNLGLDQSIPAKEQYKRFYFVDWPVLNRHKAEIVERIDWFVDGQRPGEPTFVSGAHFRTALDRMSHSVFRVRPWFEAGPWGGQWLKRQLPALPQDEPNYAWSFELIVPENGIAVSDGQYLCEMSFDWLMYYRSRQVLGASAERFGTDFPIRFDFLDTMEGGNLSLQCHPRPEYIRKQFGEPFTQDETYYIVDCKPGAEVYLGFQDNVNQAEFRAELEKSHEAVTPVDVKRYVQAVPAHPHDLFLIPSGTIHCSGANSLVLEISATPYIFTFKLYDWLRMGLDGKPRPLNIERAFENLRFDRRGEVVAKELISKPQLIDRGDDWQLIHLPTHREHFYDVHRFEFDSEVESRTNRSPHVLMMVEGAALEVVTEDGMRQRFSFLETFVIPAASNSYRLINLGPGPAKVIKAFLKPLNYEVPEGQ